MEEGVWGVGEEHAARFRCWKRVCIDTHLGSPQCPKGYVYRERTDAHRAVPKVLRLFLVAVEDELRNLLSLIGEPPALIARVLVRRAVLIEALACEVVPAATGITLDVAILFETGKKRTPVGSILGMGQEEGGQQARRGQQLRDETALFPQTLQARDEYCCPGTYRD